MKSRAIFTIFCVINALTLVYAMMLFFSEIGFDPFFIVTYFYLPGYLSMIALNLLFACLHPKQRFNFPLVVGVLLSVNFPNVFFALYFISQYIFQMYLESYYLESFIVEILILYNVICALIVTIAYSSLLKKESGPIAPSTDNVTKVIN